MVIELLLVLKSLVAVGAFESGLFGRLTNVSMSLQMHVEMIKPPITAQTIRTHISILRVL